MIGFVFFERSPRHLSLKRAEALAARMGLRARRVALTVDADDSTLDEIVAAGRPDILQLHGTESPERVAAVQRRFGRGARARPQGSPPDRRLRRGGTRLDGGSRSYGFTSASLALRRD